ncbi:DUF3019 domain-containing protein [Aliikangiella sp. IMCC44653]
MTFSLSKPFCLKSFCVIIISFVGCIAISSNAKTTKLSNAGSLGLYITPNLCLVSHSKKQCELDAEIVWRTQEKGNYCLVETLTGNQLHCWTNQNYAKIRLGLNFNANYQLALSRLKSGQKIYTQTIKLQRQIPHTRKKRRNPWRFY